MNLRDLFGIGPTTKSIPLLQQEHGFCQQNALERGQVQDWYLNEKIVVLLVCLNGRCCSSGCMGNASTKISKLTNINKDEGDESLPLLTFRRHVANAIFLKY